jgi:ElaB/YqjD/DUF883 family membrane-anchored ribosome-binding protein
MVRQAHPRQSQAFDQMRYHRHPSQPDIPVTDAPPPPQGDPVDVPLPPITRRIRASGAKKQWKDRHREPNSLGANAQQSNLSSGTALNGVPVESAAASIDGAVDDTSTPESTIQTSYERSTDMPSIKPVEDMTRDFTSDLAQLRDDIADLTSSVSKFIHSQTTATTNTVYDAVDNARLKISDTAAKTQDRVAAASTDLETTIERNPLMAVLVAMIAGITVGMLSRSRK